MQDKKVRSAAIPRQILPSLLLLRFPRLRVDGPLFVAFRKSCECNKVWQGRRAVVQCPPSIA
jgi:hypothetical protein